jgi:hypothetical protein
MKPIHWQSVYQGKSASSDKRFSHFRHHNLAAGHVKSTGIQQLYWQTMTFVMGNGQLDFIQTCLVQAKLPIILFQVSGAPYQGAS